MASEQLIKQIEQLLFHERDPETRVMLAQDTGVLAVAEGYTELGSLLIASEAAEAVHDALTFNWLETKIAKEAADDLGWDDPTQTWHVQTLKRTPFDPLGESHYGYNFMTTSTRLLYPATGADAIAEFQLNVGHWKYHTQPREWVVDFYVFHEAGYISGGFKRLMNEFYLADADSVYYDRVEYDWERRARRADDLAAVVLKASTVFPRFIAGVHELIAKTAELRS